MASLNALRTEAEAWLRAIGRAREGAFPAAADLSEVDRVHPEVTSPESAQAVRELLDSDRVSDEQRPRLKLLARFLERAVAAARSRSPSRALEDGRQRRVVEVDEATLTLAEAESALARTEDRARRLGLERGIDQACLRQHPLAEQRQEAMAEAARAMGLSSPLAIGDGERDSDAASLDPAGFLRNTADPYLDVLGWALGKMTSGLVPAPRGDATLGDLARLRDLPFYPGALPAAEARDSLREWTRTFGETPSATARFEVRTLAGATEAQGIALEIPERVLVFLPAETSAADAPATFELWGWAQGLIRTESDSPVEHRWMGDPAVRGASGWLVRGLLRRERWLARSMGLGRATARAVARMQSLSALAELRGAAALHAFARTLVESGPTREMLQDAAQTLGEALGVRVGTGATLAWLQRLGPSLDTLRAAALATYIRDEADVRFDAEEFRNPTAARWLASLWARGAPESAERMAPALSGRPLAFEPLTRDLISVLGA
jgi:hypothetical protein